MGWAQTWRHRGALLYTVGAWTVFGSVLFWSSGFLKTREEEEFGPSGDPTGTVISEDKLRETTVYRTQGKAFSVVTTTVYKPNFVPFWTGFQNYTESFFGNSGGKEK